MEQSIQTDEWEQQNSVKWPKDTITWGQQQSSSAIVSFYLIMYHVYYHIKIITNNFKLNNHHWQIFHPCLSMVPAFSSVKDWTPCRISYYKLYKKEKSIMSCSHFICLFIYNEDLTKTKREVFTYGQQRTAITLPISHDTISNFQVFPP